MATQWLHVVVLALVVAGLHVVFVTYSPGPVLYTDSMGYLASARTLAGAGQPINLDSSSFTAVGYGLLLAPAYLVTVSPHAIFLAAAGLNVVAGASISVGAYLLARDLFGTGHRASLLIGALAATYPAYLLQSGQVWPEVVLAALVVWWAVLLGRFLRSGSVLAAAGWGLVTGVAWTTHRRMAAMLLVSLLLLALVGIRQRDRRAGAIVAALSIVALVIGTYLLERWLRSTMWTTSPANDDSASKLAHHLAPAHWGGVSLMALGETWYLAASSLGLVVLGISSLVRYAVQRRPIWQGDALVAVALLAVSVGTILIGALSLGYSIGRVDVFVYGRYVDEYAASTIAAAGALIASTKPATLRRAVLFLLPAAFLLVSALLVYEIRGRSAFAGNVQKFTIPGILGEQALVEGRTVFSEAIHIRAITAIAVVAVIALFLLIRVSSTSALVAATIAFVFLAFLGETRSLHPFATFWDGAYGCVPTALRQQYGAHGDLAFDIEGFDPEARNRFQFLLPRYRIAFFDGSRQRPPAKLVVAPSSWARGRADGFRLVLGELASSVALWTSAPTQGKPLSVSSPNGSPCPAVTPAGS